MGWGYRLSLDVSRLRQEFPALDQEVNGQPLAYLDNAASTQKARAVLEALDQIYTRDYANIHRGVHQLSVRATTAYEASRASVKDFLGAADDREIVFVGGTTEGINLVAAAWGPAHVGPGDEVLVTAMEHHSNIVPWQLLCEAVGARLEVVDIDQRGQLDLEDLKTKLRPTTRLLSLAHVSNALGTINPVEEIVALARERGVTTLIDGAQAAPHLAVDVQALGCDFYVFSGHKVYGPTGIGALYGRLPVLESMPPWQGGGDMIETVSFSGTTYAAPPARFEAGTPHIAGAIGLGAACDFLRGVGLDSIAAHETTLLAYGTEALSRIEGLRLIGTAERKASVLSFVLDGVHPHDVGTILDFAGVAVRTGHHCAQPLMERLGVTATTR
ncbi:MAG: cysteine desulfurase, partial [Myxococcota bacterium]|nr:cysteine desulfurase [Myxococcota bacterium]